MEVHPPEHGIHSWRDFLVHMGTITLGLLIALALESAVEALHHRHQVQEARERIHRELEENRQTIAKDRGVLQQAWKQMQDNVKLLDAKEPIDSGKLQFRWYWSSGETSAFQTARDTGALALMPYDEVQRYADVYLQQASVNEAAQAYIQQNARTVQPLLRHGVPEHGTLSGVALSPEERRQLSQGCLDVLSQIGLILDLSASLDGLYERAK